MDRCEFSIEFAHLYYTELQERNFRALKPAIDTLRWVLKSLVDQGASYSLSVLIDDYGIDHPMRDASLLNEFLLSEGIEVDHVAYEADLAQVADVLLESLRDRYVRRSTDRVSLLIENSDSHLNDIQETVRRPKTLLLGTSAKEDAFRQTRTTSFTQVQLSNGSSDNRQYGCALLASCWTLARMGIAPYATALTLESRAGHAPFTGDRLITILSTRYIKVEATVLDLLSEMRGRQSRALRDRIRYIFHEPLGL